MSTGKKLLKLTLVTASTLSLAYLAQASADTESAPMPWKPKVNIAGQVSKQDTSTADIMVPFAGDASSMWYADVRDIYGYNRLNILNLGLGYRQLNNDYIIGGYGWKHLNN